MHRSGYVEMDVHDALMVVDLQRDFCPGGTLAVEQADRIVPVLNDWIARARQGGAVIVASRNWHPPDHVSFEQRGGPWPAHCIRGEPGADFHPRLQLPNDAIVVSKGTEPHADRHTALDDDLGQRLRERGVWRLWVGGVALDVCVLATVLEARRLGFEVHLIEPATRPVDEQSGRRAIAEMREAGAIIETSPSINPDSGA